MWSSPEIHFMVSSADGNLQLTVLYSHTISTTKQQYILEYNREHIQPSRLLILSKGLTGSLPRWPMSFCESPRFIEHPFSEIYFSYLFLRTLLRKVAPLRDNIRTV